MKSLQDIGLKFKTDKASHHKYLPLYELLFWKISSLPKQRILEIGIQFGNSLMVWKDYFINPVITGIDSVNNGVHIDGVELIIEDAYSSYGLSKVEDDFREFDLIIDDGSHDPKDQAFVVQRYAELLSRDGLLIIEDVPHKETVPYLKSQLPEGFEYTSLEMVEGTSTAPSRLFIVWRK